MKDTKMRIVVNGTPRDVSDGITLLSLLEQLHLNPNTTVVELNRDVLEKNSFVEVILAPGDHLELVRIVGGG